MSRFRSERRFLSRYAVAGLLNAAVGFFAIYVGLLLGLSPWVANASGYLVGLLFSFLTSKAFVFKSRGRTGPELWRFVAAFLVSFGANLAVLEVLTRRDVLPPILTQATAVFTYVLVMYPLSRWVVFRQVVPDQSGSARSD